MINLTMQSDLEQQEVFERNALNPQVQLRNSLLKQGFTAEQIDDAIEEMWEMDLQIDDMSQVMKYLDSKSNKTSPIQVQVQQLDDEPMAVASTSTTAGLEKDTQEETKTFSTAETTSHNGSGGDVTYDDSKYEEEPQQLLEPRAALSVQLTTTNARHKAATPPLDIASKLDLVADYENLTDAAFALSEWISQAADTEEVGFVLRAPLIVLSSFRP